VSTRAGRAELVEEGAVLVPILATVLVASAVKVWRHE
jgi:hypothetical protein